MLYTIGGVTDSRFNFSLAVLYSFKKSDRNNDQFLVFNLWFSFYSDDSVKPQTSQQFTQPIRGYTSDNDNNGTNVQTPYYNHFVCYNMFHKYYLNT